MKGKEEGKGKERIPGHLGLWGKKEGVGTATVWKGRGGGKKERLGMRWKTVEGKKKVVRIW